MTTTGTDPVQHGLALASRVAADRLQHRSHQPEIELLRLHVAK